MRSLAVPLALGALLLAVPAAAVDRLVDDGGVPCLSGALPLHTTITGAVAAASPGETILVCAGTYVDDNVTIDKANVTVRGQGLVRLVRSLLLPPTYNIRITADGVTIQNLDVTGDFPDCSIRVEAGGADIRDLQVRGEGPLSPGSFHLGICVRQGTGHRVRNNVLENLAIEVSGGASAEVSSNQLSANTVGILVGPCAATSVHHNSVVAHPFHQSTAVRVGCDAVVTNNTLSGSTTNSATTGIETAGAGVVVTRNQIQTFATGIQVGNTTGATISFNSITFSLFRGILIGNSTGMTVTRNNVSRSATLDCFWDALGANVLDKNNCGTQDPPGEFD